LDSNISMTYHQDGGFTTNISPVEGVVRSTVVKYLGKHGVVIMFIMTVGQIQQVIMKEYYRMK